MDRRFRTGQHDIVPMLLGVSGALLCLLGLLSPAQAQDFRSRQVWPDRSIGVTSGLLAGSEAQAATQVLPLGVYRASDDEAVYARTYLHFPLDVFPPGTEILRATLYMVVDTSSGVGEATLGAYRAMESWGEEDWVGDPASWPALLTSPIAVTTVRFEVVTPTLPVSVTGLITTPTATPSPTATPLVMPTVTPTATDALLPTPSTSPLPTPTPMPNLASMDDVPVVPLGQVAPTWLVWDVTALARAWLAGEIANYGLVLGSAPDLASAPEGTDSLLVARYLSAADFDTRPHLIAEFDVRPVTPTPVPPTSPLSTPVTTPWPALPPAGNPVGWKAAGLLLIGMTLLLLGLIKWDRE